MANHEPALEASYKFTTDSLNQYSIRITFADYDTGKIEGTLEHGGFPFISASFHRERAPSTKSSLTFRVNYDLWDSGKEDLTERTGTLNLTADDRSYNNLYGTLTEDGGTPIEVTLSKR
ncbi:hypothetical protein [Pseudomonas sp. W4I3]|uniref:hypothetical protein n=1 Tax=Pseudomonas sp. W4I3 TaxID=3042294 RepID=UPI00278481AE|nr:hypothetical protein [Pseudomonas sp. W4I3]MDQ0737296.1 hypothetical protein [Pseudomonas sp. W4I3]